MALSQSLNRRIKARRIEDEDIEYESTTSDESSTDQEESVTDSDDEQERDSDTSEDSSDSNDESNDSEEDSEDSVEDEQEAIKSELSKISFGALARAQASLGIKRKGRNTDNEDKKSEDEPPEKKARERRNSESSSDGKTKKKRSSKHAPAIMSSKHAVSRKRVVVEPPPMPKARDPRFDPAVQHSRTSYAALNKAYSFLNDYRTSEINQMKEALAKTKDPKKKEELQHAITSATDRLKTLENKRREKEVLAEHIKKERQALREGKKSKPYFLKKSELKKQALIKKYESMSSKDRVKALERRRKKLAAKEKKNMPWGRRFLAS
ncbi:hypothetical protein VTN49DRAFT_3651 [Thermomyces lanuginosus]|uniref:uncharacterized protein n=1 Tax=Thermomyces lanuginosus TaxID=5541 RepID=UPI003742B23B